MKREPTWKSNAIPRLRDKKQTKVNYNLIFQINFEINKLFQLNKRLQKSVADPKTRSK